jgi:hypothetical protein
MYRGSVIGGLEGSCNSQHTWIEINAGYDPSWSDLNRRSASDYSSTARNIDYSFA